MINLQFKLLFLALCRFSPTSVRRREAGFELAEAKVHFIRMHHCFCSAAFAIPS